MDDLHLQGIELIQYLQDSLQGYGSFMEFLSHVGDPRNAFLVYFPVTFFCNRLAGIQVMWVAALSEWLNALLKWILHGERPYWWVQETLLYEENHRPNLQQFSLTCESGPGSPSGHMMVTSSVLFMMNTSRFYQKTTADLTNTCNRLFMCGKYFIVLVILVLVGLSRCFISTHFPHQVCAGLIAGYLLAKLCDHLPVEKLTVPTYVISSVLLLLSAPVIYKTVEILGFDPVWSVSLATKWCAKREWVYLDTTLFFAIVRDAASLLGLGLALTYLPAIPEKVDSSKKCIAIKTICVLLSVLVTRGQEYIKMPYYNEALFYTFSFIKYASLPVIIVVVIPVFVWKYLFGIKQTSSVKCCKSHNS